MIYNNILETIGNTPIVRLNSVKGVKTANLWVKLESFNPGGSVKDRAAYNMITQAEKQGLLKPGDTIVEPSSGNTGIGLALVAAARGYKCIITIPDSATIERIKILKAYGAKVMLTPRTEGMVGAIKTAESFAGKKGHFIPMQFENYNNRGAHAKTAEEIWRDTEGKIDALFCATGTGGTVTGTGENLREKKPDIKIFATEPADSPVLSGGKPALHKLPGMGPSFIPKIIDKSLFTGIIKITTEDAYRVTRYLAKKEGIFVGISSGAVTWAMIEYAKKDEYKDMNFLSILPDTGERYLSSKVWDL